VSFVTDLRLHGSLNEYIEYFALIGGAHPSHVLSYEVSADRVRFFFRGNEFALGPEGISYHATGGGFSRYMFGMQRPREDLLLPDAGNRLVLFGAVEDDEGRIVFTDRIEGAETHQRIFRDGNAVENYYFFIAEKAGLGRKADRQARTLRKLGKHLKRVGLLEGMPDSVLLQGILQVLDEPDVVVFLFRLRNRLHSGFADFAARAIADGMEDAALRKALADRALQTNIDPYQLERIRIDTLYRVARNRKIVDEYHAILAGRDEASSERSQARLRRLRTLALRHGIPCVLLDTLDEQVLGKASAPVSREPSSFGGARSILEGLFLRDPALHGHILPEDIVRLIRTKHRTRQRHDMGFERLMMDTGKALDDHLKKTGDFTPLERFSEIVTYFDRYENTATAINRLTFIRGTVLSEDALRSIIGNKEAFDELDPGLFSELFVEPVQSDPYLPRYGRMKLQILEKGLAELAEGATTYDRIVRRTAQAAREERLHDALLVHLRKRILGVYPDLESGEGLLRLETELADELRKAGTLGEDETLPTGLLGTALLDLRKEALYRTQILPEIIKSRDRSLREDFLRNSGLDRFHVENLERQYAEEEGLDDDVLKWLQE